MLLKMTKYGLKNMLLCSKNSEIWSLNQNMLLKKIFNIMLYIIEKYCFHFVDLDDLRNLTNYKQSFFF